MSDITMVQGYGFPRGSAMDYAGYRGFAGMQYGPMRYEGPPVRVRTLPENQGTFAPIPAMDGIFGDDSGITLDVGPVTLMPTGGFVGPAGLGPDGLVHYPDGSTCDPRSGQCPGYSQGGPAVLFGLAALAIGAFLWMNR